MTSIDRRKQARGSGRRGVTHLGAHLAGAAVVAWSSPLLAQSVQAQDQAPQQEAQAGRTVAFDIPAMSLSQALTTFGRQSGLQIAFDPVAVAGKTSVALSGQMATDQALRTLLSGSGLSYQFTSAAAVTVSGTTGSSGALQLDPVQVQGFPVPPQAMIDNIPPPYAGGQVATGARLGLLGNRDVIDTPFNQTSFTAKKVQDQQAKTVREALIDDPSVRASLPEGSIAGDSIYMRGFLVDTTQISFNGLYGMLPTFSIMPEFAERVEVLKGPSAMLNGMPSSIGGSINLVAKRAPDAGLTQLMANYVSATQFGAHADVARRFGPDKQFGVRFNGVYKSGQTDVQWNTDQRALGALGLDYRSERVRLSADLGYQYQYATGLVPYFGVGNGVPLPWAPNIRNNPGGQPWNYKQVNDAFGLVRGEYDLTESITAFAGFGYHDVRYQDLTAGSSLTASNFNGAATMSPRTLGSYNLYMTGEVGVRARADTGTINHEVALTATTYSVENGFGFANGPAYATNFYNPVLVPRSNVVTPAANKASSATYSGLAFADTLSAAEKRVQLTVGARLQQVRSANFSNVTGVQTSTYDQSAFSPSVSLVFKPWENVSLYGNWIQGLQAGTVVGATFNNAGEIFPPYKTTQYEVGVKVDWGKLTTTMSLFQITQPSLLTNVATNTQILGGEQRNQGLEFNFFGEPIPGVRVLGGAMLLSAVLAKTQGGATNGWVAPFSPGLQLNLGGEWDLPYVRGLTLNSRVIYTGSQYIDTTYPRRSLPDWTRFDLGARYTFDTDRSLTGKPVSLRFNVENVLDTNYWQGGQGPTLLYVGMPRTYRLSLTADF